MARKKPRNSFTQKPAQALLILILSASAAMLLPQMAHSQVYDYDKIGRETAAKIPPEVIQSWKDYIRDYPKNLAKYQKDEEELRKKAKEITFSKDIDVNEAIKTYPFLKTNLQSTVDLQKQMAESFKGIKAFPNPEEDFAASVRIAEEFDGKKANIILVHKRGRLNCSPYGCHLDIYLDEGAGFKNAMTYIYEGPIYISRVDGKTVLFFGNPNDKKGKEPERRILKDHKFLLDIPPSPQPEAQGFILWNQIQEEDAKKLGNKDHGDKDQDTAPDTHSPAPAPGNDTIAPPDKDQ